MEKSHVGKMVRAVELGQLVMHAATHTSGGTPNSSQHVEMSLAGDLELAVDLEQPATVVVLAMEIKIVLGIGIFWVLVVHVVRFL